MMTDLIKWKVKYRKQNIKFEQGWNSCLDNIFLKAKAGDTIGELVLVKKADLLTDVEFKELDVTYCSFLYGKKENFTISGWHECLKLKDMFKKLKALTLKENI